MAPKLNKDSLNEGQTEFASNAGGLGAYFRADGRMGKWLSKFFASKAQPYVNTQLDNAPTTLHPLAGDAVSNDQIIKAGSVAWGRNTGKNNPILPEIETTRRKRYKELEAMDEYPEISSAWDIYADDCSQKDISGKRWLVISESKFVVDEVNKLFDSLKLDRMYWDIFRNTVKYGDNFIETIVDINRPKEGIKRLKILNPLFMYRIENEYGYLTDFLQEIPESDDSNTAFGINAAAMNDAKFITLDKNQIVHFRMTTSDPHYYPYGKSVAAPAIKIYRSLKMMEDAMLIYRLARAPERRVFYIDVTGMPSAKASLYIERVKEKFKKEKFYDQNTGMIGGRYNPLAADEDFFVPIKGTQKTKIETLPGADNLGDIDDVKYFRDKLLAAMKIPKDFIVEKDKSPERKANLAQLDVKFARTISRVQNSLEIGLEMIAKRHLQLKGYPNFIVKNIRIELPDSSDMFTKRKIEVDEAKARVVQAVLGTGLFPKRQIYKEYYDLTDSQIQQIQDQLEKEAEEEALKEQEKMAQAEQAGVGGAPGMPGLDDPAEPGAPMADPTDGNMESAENETPTTTEENVKILREYGRNILNEDISYSKKRILQRAFNRIQKTKED
jgi:hypothetical protein